MAIDETKSDGTVLIFKAALDYMMKDKTETETPTIFSIRDHHSYQNASTLQEFRARESAIDRLQYVAPKPGFLHSLFSILDSVLGCNWSNQNGRATGILSHFVSVLNHSRVGDGSKHYLANVRLIDTVLKGYIAAALIVQADKLAGRQITEVANLTDWVHEHDWSIIVSNVIRHCFALQKFGFLGSEAASQVAVDYMRRWTIIMQKKKNNRTTTELNIVKKKTQKAFVDVHSRHIRDRVFENNILFLSNALHVVDFHKAMKHGEVTRLEKDLNIIMINFHGRGKNIYSRLLLGRKFD